MGYTHYWEKDSIPAEDWARVVKRVRPILEAHASILSDVEIDDEVIFFNGQCETFVVERASRKDFDFCKTAAREYDPVVVACILILDEECPDRFAWSSDGRWPKEHAGGIELAGLTPESARGPSRG